MTITPTFHFVCRYCGKFCDVPGERVQIHDHLHEVNGRWLGQAHEAALEAAGCLEDTCRECMPNVHKEAAQERDFQAEKDLS